MVELEHLEWSMAVDWPENGSTVVALMCSTVVLEVNRQLNSIYFSTLLHGSPVWNM